MPLDNYDPCPCGSGKKLKFCCHSIAEEMERVAKLQENNQPRMALQILDRLKKTHPHNSWVLISRALTLLSDSRAPEALTVLSELLEKHPEDNSAIALYATTLFSTRGYEESRPAIQRAFQRCQRSHPKLLTQLATGIAAGKLLGSQFMSARQYLVLAMRLVPSQLQEDAFVRLVEFDTDSNIPYPFRSIHQLEPVEDLQHAEKEIKTAYRLADLGCWDAAANRFTRLAENKPDNAANWRNAGLCRAWDGAETEAAEALHKAAKLEDDFETAVEWETLAQLLDRNAPDQRAYLATTEFQVQSVSRLLTLLDGEERFSRESPLPTDDDDPRDLPVGMFQILDRPVDDTTSPEPLTLDSVANVIADLIVFDEVARSDELARARLNSLEGTSHEQAVKLVEEVAGDALERTETSAERLSITEFMPRDILPMQWRWHLPPKTPILHRRRLTQEKWQNILNQVWPNTPLLGLGGKTPLEAAGDAESNIPLAAAINVLDTFCQQSKFDLDLDNERRRYQLEETVPLSLGDETPISALSVIQLHRLIVENLDDTQLVQALNRGGLTSHPRFLNAVILELLNRPQCSEQVDLDRVYVTLVELCQDRHQRDEALSWIAKARDAIIDRDNEFEHRLQWDMRELGIRTENPEDPQLNPLLDRFADYYFPKLPQLQVPVTNMLLAFDIPVPWDLEPGVVSSRVDQGTTTPAGVWTPEATQPSDRGAEKLWLPGQD